MRRIHIVGRKNSGKTTLIRELVAHYVSLGNRVGTIKHTHHEHELDVPGKDSYLHRQAGAEVVGILAANMQAVFWDQSRAGKDVAPYARMLEMFADCDLVLVEGDLEAAATKVEVWRAANHAMPIALERRDIAAVISDDQAVLDCPLWARADVAALSQHLLDLAVE
jgi:molybdopterin-guanine dinucleotide biosynthesis protein B